MAFRDRLPGRGARPGTVRSASSSDLDHLREWASTRQGVEGFVEPATHTTSMTLVLVAGDGEWSRRRIDSPKAAFGFGQQAGIPVYDVAAVGYPARMREWTARQKGTGESAS